MSKIDSYLIEQDEIKQAPKEKVLDFVNDTASLIPELQTFIEAIMPQKGHFFLFQGKELKNHPEYTDRKKYALMLSFYCTVKENLYIVPFGFDGWANGNNAISTRCVFVDIDTPKCKPDDLNEIEKAYELEFQQAHPSFIIKSGNGLHFYFLIPELDLTNYNDCQNREIIINKLITLYGADVHCKDFARKMRCPMSYNCKETITQSKFIYSNEALIYTIPQLLNIDIDEVEYKKYIKDQWQDITNKRLATMQANNKPRKKKERLVVSKQKQCYLDYESKFNRRNPLENRRKNLHNYFVRHDGNIKGCRDSFVFIIANTLKAQGKTQQEALNYTEKYFENDDFMKEAITIIANTYESQKLYKFSNEKIAEMLDFDEDDMAQSYGLFDSEAKEAHKKAKWKRQKAKQKLERQEKNNKDGIKKYVRDNMDAPIKELALVCGVSTRTINNIKKSILDGE